MPSTADPGWWKKPQENRFPTLPAETWIHIFEIATYVPWALETETRDPFGVSAPLLPSEERDALSHSFVTKRALVLVCRQWRELALPIMYQIVTVRCLAGLQRLYRAMAVSPKSEGIVICTSVRRLHCTIDPEESSKYDWNRLAEIIGVLPNLAIFNIRARGMATHSRYEMSKSMVRALKLRGPSLRVLDWKLMDVTGMEDEYERDLLSYLPNLRILQISGDRPWSMMVAPCDLTPIYLPHLVSMSWAHNGRGSRLTSVDELPSLRSLEMVVRVETYMSDGIPPPNMCNSFTSLTLHHVYMPWDPSDYFLWKAYAAMPNLTQLVVWLRSWEAFPVEAKLPPGIEKLGLGREDRRPSENSVYRQLFEGLYTINAPKLKVVRFVGGDEWSDLPERSPKVLARLRELGPTRSFRVEGPNGKLLVDL
ncbi:hypothetical protein NEOLEDRAFT_645244 [Neolentinus lepideus HHB14362 ss-1]|uniref:F-box domain-containing protein n=1 Tax=Neolentinus lepideus HHB14362 ss-1 TaxID=1314782 RepID=A0A165QLT6_9AGAM|nr:hypothetical protein NEOLEDRAFT_645244 [Neolentinus lepideus HHB14362 ss-1]